MARLGQLIFVLSLVVGICPAMAQTDPIAAMDRYVHTDAYVQFLLFNFKDLPLEVFPRCDTGVFEPKDYVLFQPVSWTSYGRPKTGAWKQEVFAGGCGNDAIWSVYFTAVDEHHLEKKFSYPGETRVDLSLQEEARNAAASGALAVVNCGLLFVRNTHFEGYEKVMKSDKRSWRETWTLIGCGSLIQVPLTFSPRPGGGLAIGSRAGTAFVLNADGSNVPQSDSLPPRTAMTVPPEAKVKVLSVSSLKRNCAKRLLPPLEILIRPKNGKVTLEQEDIEAKEVQESCGLGQVPGLSLYYAGKRGFVGSDSVTVEIFNGDGTTTKAEYVFDVGAR